MGQAGSSYRCDEFSNESLSHYSFINVGSIVFMVKHMYPGRITRRGCAVLLLSYRLLSHRMFLCVPLHGFV